MKAKCCPERHIEKWPEAPTCYRRGGFMGSNLLENLLLLDRRGVKLNE